MEMGRRRKSKKMRN